MGSVTFHGVRFYVYANDHLPRHVHGLYGQTRAIIDLLPDGDVQLAKRSGDIFPNHAKKAEMRKILQIAADHFEELIQLWERIHGNT